MTNRKVLFWAVLAVSAFASVPSAGAQRESQEMPLWADSTGESDTYPVGREAVAVYRAVLDLLYVDGKERPGTIVLWDSASRMAGGPCPMRVCRDDWPHKSKMDTATILAYARPSLKRPRIIDFGYSIPIARVSSEHFERIRHDGHGILANRRPDQVGPLEAFWAGFRGKYPRAWGYAILSKVAFNRGHSEALIGVYQACGESCNSQEAIFLRRIGKEWRVIERIAEQTDGSRTSGNLRYRGPTVKKEDQGQIVATEAPGSQPRAESADAAKVYRALLDRLYLSDGRSPRSIVISQTHAYGPDDLPMHRSTIDSSTVASYKFSAQVGDAVLPFSHRLRIHWVSQESLQQLEPSRIYLENANHPTVIAGWKAFGAKYPDAWGYASLGRVAFNHEHTQALVFARHLCGDSCVTADTWFLERKRETWYVVERMPRAGQASWDMADSLRYLGADADPRMYRPRRLRGVFTNAATGKVMPNLKVEVETGDQLSFFYTDRSGRYTLDNLPLFGLMMRVECRIGPNTESLAVKLLPISPGLDSTVNVAVNYSECPSGQPNPQLAPNAPPDRPIQATRECVWLAMDHAMQPLIAKARGTWPVARRRFLAGLLPRQSLFVTVLLVDAAGLREQVFVAVESIRDGRITGKLWNRIDVVSGYQIGDSYAIPEVELRDWTIAMPDGTEEGNVVGKFLETYELPAKCLDGTTSG